MPVDSSVKLTFSGAGPAWRLAEKFATTPLPEAETTMNPLRVIVFEPPDPVTVRLTEYVPGLE